MKKLKEGKLDRKWFWCIIVVTWVLMTVLFLVGTRPRAPISNGRLLAISVLFIIYLAAIVMRLRDTGKSLACLVIFFICPLFMIVIGCWESEKPHWVESESDEQGALPEWTDNERK